MELETINASLQKEVENYMSADEQARALLNRRKKMTELLNHVEGKLEATGSTIAHLR